MVNLVSVTVRKPEPVNLILGQAHFIKSVEDLHEALVTAVPHAAFGLAFCEGIEAKADIAARKELLRRFGYKL